MTANEYICGVKDYGLFQFAGKLWLRNYYECVIRDGESFVQVLGCVVGDLGG